MEDRFAKVDVISGNIFQDLKNNFSPFPQDEDGVSQPLKAWKHTYSLHKNTYV